MDLIILESWRNGGGGKSISDGWVGLMKIVGLERTYQYKKDRTLLWWEGARGVF